MNLLESSIEHKLAKIQATHMGYGAIEREKAETCEIHHEPIIAKDGGNPAEIIYGCNKCVFERKLRKPVFLAF